MTRGEMIYGDLRKVLDPEYITTEPHFSSEAQETFVSGGRIFDKQTLREGEYLGRRVRYSDVAIVSFDGDRDETECSFNDIKNLYR